MGIQQGRFIVLDGNEGCGKSTQLQQLHDRLLRGGRDVLAVRDPGTTRIGERIRGLLLDPEHDEMAMRCEMLLYMAARAQMMAEAIRPALEAGTTVLCDRFISSTLAYQLGGDGLSFDEIRTIGDVAIKQRWPDQTIILDMPAEKSALRVKPKFQTGSGVEKDRIEQRPLAYHAQVRQHYLDQVRAMPERYTL